MGPRQVSGVFPPIPTPFDASGAIDFDGLTRNLTWWTEQDLAGYVLVGSNGEAVHLTINEKLELIEFVRGRVPAERALIAGTGLPSTVASIALCTEAAKAGADLVLVLPPSFYRGQMTDDALRAHFEAVADASPVPVLIYNMPANTGLDLSADLIAALSTHSNIAGLKDSSGNVAKLAELRGRLGPGFALLAGSASFFLPALSAGADGGILALANIAPSVCADIFGLAERGAWGEAREIQSRIVRANTAVTRRWGVPALKAAMDMIGLCGGPPRRPLLPLPGPQRQELRTILSEAGILSAKETR